jgi:DNA-directed RNA polymerase subunit RPC12/RpoP
MAGIRCSKVLQRDRSSEHTETCAYRSVTCGMCSERVLVSEKQYHVLIHMFQNVISIIK